MRRVLLVLMFILCLGSLFSLQGCESEQSKLEKERTRLELEKLKREAEQQKKIEETNKHLYDTDKLKNFKPTVEF